MLRAANRNLDELVDKNSRGTPSSAGEDGAGDPARRGISQRRARAHRRVRALRSHPCRREKHAKLKRNSKKNGGPEVRREVVSTRAAERRAS
jgi:hypothetical protein